MWKRSIVMSFTFNPLQGGRRPHFCFHGATSHHPSAKTRKLWANMQAFPAFEPPVCDPVFAAEEYRTYANYQQERFEAIA